jgi:hypothetical protein
MKLNDEYWDGTEARSRQIDITKVQRLFDSKTSAIDLRIAVHDTCSRRTVGVWLETRGIVGIKTKHEMVERVISLWNEHHDALDAAAGVVAS